MKRKVCWLILAAINLIMVSAFLVQAAELSKIEVRPGPLSTRVIFIADSPVQVQGLSYVSDTPPVLSMELLKARPIELPSTIEPGSRLVKKISIEPLGENLRVKNAIKRIKSPSACWWKTEKPSWNSMNS